MRVQGMGGNDSGVNRDEVSGVATRGGVVAVEALAKERGHHFQGRGILLKRGDKKGKLYNFRFKILKYKYKLL